jgi:hypothetical protein
VQRVVLSHQRERPGRESPLEVAEVEQGVTATNGDIGAQAEFRRQLLSPLSRLSVDRMMVDGSAGKRDESRAQLVQALTVTLNELDRLKRGEHP